MLTFVYTWNKLESLADRIRIQRASTFLPNRSLSAEVFSQAAPSNLLVVRSSLFRLGRVISTPKKRRSRGRSKGGKGRSELVQCSNCGMLTPRDKVKRVTQWVSLVEPTLARELRAKGAYIARQRVMKNLCVSCSVHFGVSKVRSADERRL